MNSVIRKIIFTSIFILPFVFIPRSFYGIVFPKALFVEGVTLVLGTLWIIGKLFKKEKETEKIPKNIVFLIFGIYVLLLLVSCFSGVLPALSFWSTFDQGTGVVFMLCLLIFSIITSSVFKKIDDWYKIFTVFVCSGIVFTLGSLLAEMGVRFSKFLTLNTVNGFLMGNSSWTGIYLAFIFFVSLGLTFASKTKTQKIIGILGVLTAFFNPTLTGFVAQFPGMEFGFIGLAKTASYSIFVGIGIFCLYLIFRRIHSLKWRKVFTGSVLAVLLIGIISISFIGLNPMRNLIAEKAGPNRLVYWDIAIQGFKDRPVLGWGGDTYQFVYGKYFNPIILTPGYAREYWVDRSHNIYLDELVTGGILGFLSLISLYGIVLFGLIRKAIKEREREGILYIALFSGMASFLIQGVMIFQTVTGWFIVALLIAFVSNFCFKDKNKIEIDTKKNHKHTNNNQGFNFLITFFILVIFCILFNYLIIKPYQIDNGMGKYPAMLYVERLEFLKELDSAYVGNMVDLGSLFAPYHIKLREFIKKGVLKDEEKQLMIKEIKEINVVLENGLKRQNYRDMKSLMSSVGFYSILTGMSPISERQMYYDQGMFFVNKMAEISDKNPIVILSKKVLNMSLKYGEAGVNALETDETKLKR
ncbi:MAG: O-antigen ligase family protein [Candidatus Paceibacterota bacterium]|jgi:O-antigen ligase